MARAEGLEPPTLWFEAKYSIQLSYARAKVESKYNTTVVEVQSSKFDGHRNQYN